MKKILVKIFTFLICSAVSAGTIINFASEENSAKTIPEIQEERRLNEEKIAEYEKQISDLNESISGEQEVQQAIAEQVALIQENISLLNQELEKLESDIKNTNDNISFLDYSIVEQQKQVDENIELFKKRLCAMYMTGDNDSIISVLFGSESFYDMMTRFKVVNNMAEYDEQLISSILNDITNLEKDKKDLETEKQSLEMKLAEQETKKSEKTAEIQSLNEKMLYSQSVVEQISAQQNKIQNSKEDAEKLRADFDEQEQQIQEEIKRRAEEAQRLYEEEQLRKKQQELLKKQQETQISENKNLYEQWIQEQNPPQSESIPEPSEQTYIWPTPNYYYVTSYYGEREGLQHRGIDVGDAGIDGAVVCAVRDGVVISVYNSCVHNYGKDGSCGCGGDYGNYVIISHDGTYSTIYAHMAYATVSVGDYVQQGQAIGAVGSTGWSTGAHLHFEFRIDGVAVNPLEYISP